MYTEAVFTKTDLAVCFFCLVFGYISITYASHYRYQIITHKKIIHSAQMTNCSLILHRHHLNSPFRYQTKLKQKDHDDPGSLTIVSLLIIDSNCKCVHTLRMVNRISIL